MAAKVLTIAVSDSGGGAGIQVDLKSFSAMDVYGASVITAITAQNTLAVTAVHPMSDDVVAEQIAAVLDDIDMGAIKVGMLGTLSLIETAQLLDQPEATGVETLTEWKARIGGIPLFAIGGMSVERAPGALALGADIVSAALNDDPEARGAVWLEAVS